MTPDQYKSAIKALGLSQERAGERLGYSPRSSQGWALGEYPVPKAVAMLLESLALIKQAIDWFEGEGMHWNADMLRERLEAIDVFWERP